MPTSRVLAMVDRYRDGVVPAAAVDMAELGSRPGDQSVERVPPLFPKVETPA
jgi:hypothetical protein